MPKYWRLLAVGQRSAAHWQPQPYALAARRLPTNDGYVAINVAVEEHWHHLRAAISRGDLRDDSHFRTKADRVAHIDETDTLVGARTQTLCRMEVFTISKRITSLAPLV